MIDPLRYPLADKVGVIPNISTGLGRAIARQLANHGAGIIAVVSSERHRSEALNILADIGAKVACVDLERDELQNADQALEGLLMALDKTFGRRTFDFLINQASEHATARIEQLTADDLDRLYAAHFKTTVMTIQRLVPLIENGGSIVNVTSALTHHVFPGKALFASMTGAMEVLTRYLAVELGARSIRVNSIAPGLQFEEAGAFGRFDTPALAKFISSKTPLALSPTLDDLAALVTALLYDQNRFITGQRIEAAGGFGL